MMSLATMLASGKPSLISFRDSWPKQQPTSCARSHKGRAAGCSSHSCKSAGKVRAVTGRRVAVGRGLGGVQPRLAVPISRQLGSAGRGLSAAWVLCVMAWGDRPPQQGTTHHEGLQPGSCASGVMGKQGGRSRGPRTMKIWLACADLPAATTLW